MKPLLFHLFLFLSISNLFAQRRIIFPEDKPISHADSMGIILIDHIYNGRRQQAMEMLKNGKVGGHVVDRHGFFALQYAVLQCDTSMISLLIDKGALIGERGSVRGRVQTDWWYFYYWHRHFNFIEEGAGILYDSPLNKDEFRDSLIIDYMTRKHPNLINSSKTKNNLLSRLISQGKIRMLEKLLDRGISMPDSFITYNSPIIFACHNGNYESFMFFVGKGYKIDVETEDGCNALHFACLGGNEKIIRYLIEKGIDKHKRNVISNDKYYTYPTTPLLCLLKSNLNSPELINLFLDKKLNLSDDYWYFLLYRGFYDEADWDNVYSVAKILIEKGLSPNYIASIVWIASNDGKNSILNLGMIPTFEDEESFEIANLLVRYGLRINYFRNTYSILQDAFTSFERGRSYSCSFTHYKTYNYLNAICPYYLSWGREKPKDQTVIPMKPCSIENNYNFYFKDF